MVVWKAFYEVLSWTGLQTLDNFKKKVVFVWKVITVKILLNLILTSCSNCQILLTFHYYHYAQCNHVHYVQTGWPGWIWYKVIHLTVKQLLYCFDFYFKEICLYLVLLLRACVTAVNAISVNPRQKYYKYLRVCYKRTVIFPYLLLSDSSFTINVTSFIAP